MTERHEERTDGQHDDPVDPPYDAGLDAEVDTELDDRVDSRNDAGLDTEVGARHDDPPGSPYDEGHDAEVDGELDRLDDGGGLVGPGSGGGPARSEALPFVLTAREHFASAGDVEITGDARVDAATARLAEVPDLPTADHVAVYDDVHRRLQDALADADVR